MDPVNATQDPLITPKPGQLDCPKCPGVTMVGVFPPGKRETRRIRCPNCGRRFDLIQGLVAVKPARKAEP